MSEELKCPKCSSKMSIFGSECYPESGFSMECSDLECDWSGPELSYDKRTDNLKQAIIAAFNVLEENK